MKSSILEGTSRTAPVFLIDFEAFIVSFSVLIYGNSTIFSWNLGGMRSTSSYCTRIAVVKQ
jgi:hypothetical protein